MVKRVREMNVLFRKRIKDWGEIVLKRSLKTVFVQEL